jgi:phenylpyruvate tautomerase PptA (4-oxalocrotonate tautomerase family)
MPIIDVQLVRATAEPVPADLAPALADVLAQVFGAGPGRAWVRLTTLPRTQYAENGGAYPFSELPVFVTVLHAEPPVGADRAAEASAVAQAVADCISCAPERVHVEYAPPGRGRMAFGGNLIT